MSENAYQINRKHGLSVQGEEGEFQITDYSLEHFGYTISNEKFICIYEEQDGTLMEVHIEKDTIQKQPLLYSRKAAFQNRVIFLEAPNGELCLFFSAQYKRKHFILYYRKRHGVRIFDWCDCDLFQTILRNNGEIVVLYEKQKRFCYRTLIEDFTTNFVPLEFANPVKLFEWNEILYVLTFENRYCLYDITHQKKYELPLEYHQKPYLFCQDGHIYILYRYFHKKVIYIFQNNQIVFYKEEED